MLSDASSSRAPMAGRDATPGGAAIGALNPVGVVEIAGMSGSVVAVVAVTGGSGSVGVVMPGALDLVGEAPTIPGGVLVSIGLAAFAGAWIPARVGCDLALRAFRIGPIEPGTCAVWVCMGSLVAVGID